MKKTIGPMNDFREDYALSCSSCFDTTSTKRFLKLTKHCKDFFSSTRKLEKKLSRREVIEPKKPVKLFLDFLY